MRDELLQTEPHPFLAGEPLLLAMQEVLSRRTDNGDEWLQPVSIFNPTMVGEFLRAQRKHLKFSQAELARRAGLGRRFICELEAGKRRMAFNHVLRACHSAGLDLAIGCRER